MKNKKTIISILVFILTISLLGYLAFGNKDKNDYTNISNEKNLEKIKTNYSFEDNLYQENSDEYLINESEHIVPYLNYIYENDEEILNIKDLPTDKLLYILNILLSGAGNDLCYKESFIKEKINDFFGRSDIVFSNNSLYYEYNNNKICFEQLMLNGEVKASANKITKNDNYITIELSEGELEIGH
ncbi:MAG: hypothetical protein ACI31R_03970 [Bacilli bacterium]